MPSQEARILLVDDDEEDYLITRDLLSEIEGANFQLDWVADFESAREALARAEHDVYLLDYRLGAHTGLDLLREAAQLEQRVPIILLTGQSDHELDMEAMRAGAADYLVKGQLDPALLERAIRYARVQFRTMRELEETRLREQQRFEELDQLKSDLIAFVSHELRAPLTSVKGYAETLLTFPADEQLEAGPEFLGHIVSEAERLLRLANAFLDISTIDSGHSLELVKEKLDVPALITKAVTIASQTAVRCTFTSDLEQAPAQIVADRDKLLQVLINLLSNADKYSPAGGEILVRCEGRDDTVRFEVVDHGLGIAPEARAELFTPFYRVRGKPGGKPERKIRGAGLGLYLSRHLVESHGGQIGVESTPGQGSTFWFTLPYEAPETDTPS